VNEYVWAFKASSLNDVNESKEAFDRKVTAVNIQVRNNSMRMNVQG